MLGVGGLSSLVPSSFCGMLLFGYLARALRYDVSEPRVVSSVFFSFLLFFWLSLLL